MKNNDLNLKLLRYYKILVSSELTKLDSCRIIIKVRKLKNRKSRRFKRSSLSPARPVFLTLLRARYFLFFLLPRYRDSHRRIVPAKCDHSARSLARSSHCLEIRCAIAADIRFNPPRSSSPSPPSYRWFLLVSRSQPLWPPLSPFLFLCAPRTHTRLFVLPLYAICSLRSWNTARVFHLDIACARSCSLSRSC